MTHETLNRGNRALEMTIFVLTTEEARSVKRWLVDNGEARPGSYWQHNAIRPINRAIRSRGEARIVTSGFSTSEFARFADYAGIPN